MTMPAAVHGAPLAVSATRDTLAAAIAAARPGTTITVATAGANLALALSGAAKADPGVCVVLPVDQTVYLTVAGDTGIWFEGGTFAADWSVGETGGAFGVNMAIGSGRLSINGARFGKSQNCFYASGATDVILTNSVLEFPRSDAIQLNATSRFRWQASTTGDQFVGTQICYFTDGTTPVLGTSQAQCTTLGGTWQDGAHADLFQAFNGCTDIVIDDIEADFIGAGIVSYGTGATWNRADVTNCVLNTYTTGAIDIIGTNLRIVSNTVGIHPTAGAAGPIRMEVEKIDGAATVRAGLNAVTGVGSVMIFPAGINPAAAENGDTVTAPTPVTGMTRPDWFPTAATPSPSPIAAPVSGGEKPFICGAATTAVVGDYLTCGRGQWSGSGGATYAFRWTRDNTPISGATSSVYQVQAADSPSTVRCEVQATNSAGSSAYTVTSNSRIVA